MKDWNAAPILSARNLTRRYGEHIGCRDVSFDLWPGEVLGIVGESGSGKSTLLNMLSGRMEPTSGTIAYRDAAGRERNIHALPEGEKRRLLRSELGFVHQRPSDGLRMQVSAGANIGERLMAEGARHYGTLRGRALQWLERVEIDAGLREKTERMLREMREYYDRHYTPRVKPGKACESCSLSDVCLPRLLRKGETASAAEYVRRHAAETGE